MSASTAPLLDSIRSSCLPQDISLQLTWAHASAMERLVAGESRPALLFELGQRLQDLVNGWEAIFIIDSGSGPEIAGPQGPIPMNQPELFQEFWKRIVSLPSEQATHAAGEGSIGSAIWNGLWPDRFVKSFSVFSIDSAQPNLGALLLVSNHKESLEDYETKSASLMAGLAGRLAAHQAAAHPAPPPSLPDPTPAAPLPLATDDPFEPLMDRYRKIFDMAGEGLCILDEKGTIAMANRKFASMLGLALDQMLGVPLAGFAASGDPEDPFHQALIRDTANADACLKHSNGNFFWLKLHTSQMRSENDEFQGTLAVFKEAPAEQPAVSDSAERLEATLRSTPVGVFQLDGNGVIVYAEGGALEAMQETSASVIGRSAWDFCQDTSARFRVLRRLARQRDAVATIPIGDATYELKLHPTMNADGVLLGISGVATEVTRLESTRREATKEKYRLLNTLNSMGDGLIVVDHQGLITLMNRSAEELTGMTSHQAVGHPLGQVVVARSATSSASVFENWEEVSSWRSGLEISDLILHRSENSRTEASVVIEHLKDPLTGQLNGAVLCWRNTTEFNARTRERTEQEHFNSLSIFAGGIAHDLNNILTALVGNVSLANMLVETVPEASERLIEAERACFRAKDLSHQLLTFSKGSTPVKKVTQLEDLINQCSEFYLRGSNAVPRISICSGLWSVSADESQISQVLENLIINADQAMPHGGIIAIDCDNFTYDSNEPPERLPLEDGLYVKMKVKDEGPGISEEHLEHIFKPYYTTQESGCGLGLATVYTVVKNHGGHVAVGSSMGDGTEFTAYLPATGKSKQPEESSEPLATPSNPQTRTEASGRILVIDDEKSIRDLAITTLNLLGCEVTTCPSSSEGVQRFIQANEEGQPFDLVIMDLTIPGDLGGNEAMQQILNISPRARGIASSGYSEGSVMAHFREYGFQAALSKPYNIGDLQRVVANMLQG